MERLGSPRRWVLSLSKSPAFLRFVIMMGNNDQRNRNWNPLVGSLSNDDGNPKDVVKMNWSISPRLIEIWQIHSVCLFLPVLSQTQYARQNSNFEKTENYNASNYTAKCLCHCGLLELPNSRPNYRKVTKNTLTWGTWSLPLRLIALF